MIKIYKVGDGHSWGWVYSENPRLINMAVDSIELDIESAPEHIRDMYHQYKRGEWVSDLEKNIV